MKKKNALLLLLLSASLALPSCGEAAAPANADNTPDVTPDAQPAETEAETQSLAEQYRAALPAEDYGGYTYKMLTKSDTFTVMSLFTESETGEILNDTVYARNRAVEELYNVKFSYTEVGDVDSTVKKFVTAGAADYDIMFNWVKLTLTSAVNGYYYNLHSVDSIDLSKPWWDKEVAELLTLDDKLYIGFTDASVGLMDLLYCVYVNNDLVAQYDLESPYDLVIDGKWTMDKFYEMSTAVAKDLNGDGKMDKDDQYGFITGIGSYNAWMNSGNQPYILFDTDGSLILRYSLEPSLAVAEKVAMNINDKNCCVYLNEQPWGEDTFYNGNALFIEGTINRFNKLREFDLSFGVLPSPKYDEAQAHYNAMMSNCSLGVSVPVTAEDIDRTGTVLEALGAYSYETLRNAYYEITLKDKLTRDEYSAKMLDIIIAGRCVDYGVLYENAWGNIITGYLSSIHSKGTSELSSLYAKNEEKFKKTVDKIVTAYQGLDD